MIPISISTKSEKLRHLCSTPIIGGLIIAFIAIGIPVLISTLIIAVYHPVLSIIPHKNLQPVIAAGIGMPWNLFLEALGMKIKLIFIPAWVVCIGVGVASWFGE